MGPSLFGRKWESKLSIVGRALKHPADPSTTVMIVDQHNDNWVSGPDKLEVRCIV